MRSTTTTPHLISLVTGLPSQSRQSLLSSPVYDVTSTSAPASWTAQCGDRTYLGSFTVMMDWAECRDYCKYSPMLTSLGTSWCSPTSWTATPWSASGTT